MSRLEEVEEMLDTNLALITQYSQRIATLINTIRRLEKERERLTRKKRGDNDE